MNISPIQQYFPRSHTNYNVLRENIFPNVQSLVVGDVISLRVEETTVGDEDLHIETSQYCK